MLYDSLLKEIKNQLYIVSFERFEASNNRILERFVCKHPLLTPELIVVDDQAHGFRSLNKRLKSLEQFSIFCELEYEKEPESEHIDITYIDLFSEVVIDIQNRFNELEHLALSYEDYVCLHQINQVGDSEDGEAFLICSTIDDFFDQQEEVTESYLLKATKLVSENQDTASITLLDLPKEGELEELVDDDDLDTLLEQEEAKEESVQLNHIKSHFKQFNTFIKLFDAVFIKGHAYPNHKVS